MKVIAIVGPTAVGKSSLAIELAQKIDGEIISCDSMQIYRKMDIGTAKATIDEQKKIKHHLIDIKDPNEDFSCADYSILAKNVIDDISSRNKIPIFCGGTGLYLDSVIEIPSFCDTAKDENYRKELEEYAKVNGANALHKMLESVDMESAKATHANNIKRVIRALEIFKCTGRKKSELDALSKTVKPPYDATVFFLTYENKELLYSKIEDRVDKMLEDGLLEECRELFENGMLKDGSTASGAIGYKELLPYIKGEDTLENCIEKLKLSTRHYAKRQITWFKKKHNYHTICVDKVNALKYALDTIGEEFYGNSKN